MIARSSIMLDQNRLYLRAYQKLLEMNNHFDGVMELLSQHEEDVRHFADAASQLASRSVSDILLIIFLRLAEDRITPSTGRRPQKTEDANPRHDRSNES
jgi:hypothetical protein